MYLKRHSVWHERVWPVMHQLVAAQATARLVEYVPGGFGRTAALMHIKANVEEDMRLTDSRVAGAQAQLSWPGCHFKQCYTCCDPYVCPCALPNLHAEMRQQSPCEKPCTVVRCACGLLTSISFLRCCCCC